MRFVKQDKGVGPIVFFDRQLLLISVVGVFDLTADIGGEFELLAFVAGGVPCSNFLNRMRLKPLKLFRGLLQGIHIIMIQQNLDWRVIPIF